ncbi:hypothetical protein [Streptomyces sp. CB03238]|uniref:hypothetical protein n=1 Tax=Streptomyces sp. CB03238 TaxID=1907777 RepID=UPI000A11F20D|nr:hypothetical protein [Streptomyces sp. CB03238]ORT58123.1 hypothetical protein BKD26_19640 [Streptomyces sp. CB03238]
MDSEVEAYLEAVRQAPMRLIEPYLTSVCTECDTHVASSDPDGHVLVGSSVVIGCEGYWLIDPNVVGISYPDWCDWRVPVQIEAAPSSLYERGEALVKFAEGLGLVDAYVQRDAMGGMFYDPQLIGAAIAAMQAWLECRWGPVAVRAAEKEAMYFTEDESYIGEVPSFTYGGKRLSVGDEVVCATRGANGEERSFQGVIKAIGPTYWGSELCPTGVQLDVPEENKNDPVDWEFLTKVPKS